ncbi:MAG TPA: alpha/beta fold hydrolase [Pyrinomonadaceae bacterium]|nr:alpha/beta fold hydrolase [Pyrinomonadaceae bacterium]
MANGDSVLNDPQIKRFLDASTLERFEMAFDEGSADKLRAYMGDEAFTEFRQLAAETLAARRKGDLSPDIPPNMIFVPGVMGSLLLSRKMGGIWWIDMRTRDYIKELKLAPDGKSDARKEYDIAPCTVDITYAPFFSAVNRTPDFNHEIFAYDWRKPLSASAAALRDLIEKTYAANANQPVHLVAHSMGGLMVRAALPPHGDDLWKKIGRIVFIGTPHYGSPSIAGYLKNHLWGFELMALLGLYLDRETFRSLWGVLSLLPAPRGIYPGTRASEEQWSGAQPEDTYVHPCANFDMYKVDPWKLELTPQQADHLQNVLDGAAEFHRSLYEAHTNLSQDERNRMAVIAGVGYETLFRLAYKERLWGAWTSMEKVTGRVAGDPHREGDGRVPLASASLENVGTLRYVKGVHGELPMLPPVYEDVFRWLRGEEMLLPTSAKGALKGHLSGTPVENPAPNLTRITTGNPTTGDPGFLNLNPPDPQALQQLDALLSNDDLPAFNKIRLL